MRHFQGIDRLLAAGQRALQTIDPVAGAVSASTTVSERSAGATVGAKQVGDVPELSPAERNLSGGLMRVNHVGEVCAQALYEGQAMATDNEALRQEYLRAAQEEGRHLDWTAQRLRELGTRPSLLNPLWYGGAFAMGLLASRLGDRTALGFMAETERQVEQHLQGHLHELPAADQRSRDVVAAMKVDEARHAQFALEAGAAELSAPVKWLMRRTAAVMTTVARYI